MTDLADILTQAREAQGLSLREVARRAGVSPSSIHDWERGVKSPTLPGLVAWCWALDAQLDVKWKDQP